MLKSDSDAEVRKASAMTLALTLRGLGKSAIQVSVQFTDFLKNWILENYLTIRMLPLLNLNKKLTWIQRKKASKINADK